ncbi:MAG: PA4780 family RIO1-like protein kinase [Oceanococcus sp.]
MKIPKTLQPLIDDGIVDRVLRQLQSGKEAAVFLVDCGGDIRCAKVYKDVGQRSFQQRVQYQEGRKTRRGRDARAMGKRSSHGRKVEEAEWKTAEVDALYRLSDAGVRVPKPYGMFGGVLLMELVCGEDGLPAPRLNEVSMSKEEAHLWHDFMVKQVVLMLCAGLIHGDLSEFNVLLGTEGPVVIDLPQVVNAAGNNNAFAMLERDVNNMRATFAHFAPELLNTRYAREIWALYEAGDLHPDSPLTGQFEDDTHSADVEGVLDDIEDARFEAEARELGRLEEDDDFV